MFHVSVARNDRRDDRKRKEQMSGRRNKTNYKIILKKQLQAKVTKLEIMNFR